MSAKHTPGPWIAPSAGIYVEATGEQVASIEALWDADLRANGGKRNREMTANARLIAAAPDMLAAAKSARLMYYAWRAARLRLGLADDHEELNREIERIESAIAKAEGA